MGLLRGLRGTVAARGGAAPARLDVHLVAHDRSCDTEDDGPRWSRGFRPIHRDTHGADHFLTLGEHLCDGEVLYCEVVGIEHHGAAIDDACFEPGSPTLLIPEPWNEHDPNAVGVWDLHGAIQVGHIPAEHCAEVASRLNGGEHLVGYVMREIRRGSKVGPRSALHLLVGPAGALTLSVIDG